MTVERKTKMNLLLMGATLLLAGLLFTSVVRAVDDVFVALVVTALALVTAASFVIPADHSSRRLGRG